MEPTPQNQQEEFNPNTSPMREAYLLLGAKTPVELSNLYTEEDQKLFTVFEWDYENPDQIPNKIKTILENIDVSLLTKDEKQWRQEILWFWYHHAISVAVHTYKDKNAAQSFATKALELKPINNPNQITRLLYLLVHDRIEEAEEWAKQIDDEDEKNSAERLIGSWSKYDLFSNDQNI